mmetsp:Transcript_51225/g.146269  ORF Transcript_51225/g.146269 Transcript_51225/m.146269 type:complete len:359 (+) Transcript_51225:184-1260(+)
MDADARLLGRAALHGLNGLKGRVQEHLNVVIFQRLLDRLLQRGVEHRQECREGVDENHLGPQPREDQRVLNADDASSLHNHLLRDPVDALEVVGVVDPRELEARRREPVGLRAGRNDDGISLQGLLLTIVADKAHRILILDRAVASHMLHLEGVQQALGLVAGVVHGFADHGLDLLPRGCALQNSFTKALRVRTRGRARHRLLRVHEHDALAARAYLGRGLEPRGAAAQHHGVEARAPGEVCQGLADEHRPVPRRVGRVRGCLHRVLVIVPVSLLTDKLVAVLLEDGQEGLVVQGLGGGSVGGLVDHLLRVVVVRVHAKALQRLGQLRRGYEAAALLIVVAEGLLERVRDAQRRATGC